MQNKGHIMDLEECIEKGLLKKERIEKERIKKELNESKKDFSDAKESFKTKKFKWAIIQCYYSMFHAVRAVLFSYGLKERSHFTLSIFLEHLVKENKLDSKFLNDFKAAMFLRESADYRAEYSRERAEKLLEIAKEFNKEIKKLIKL